MQGRVLDESKGLPKVCSYSADPNPRARLPLSAGKPNPVASSSTGVTTCVHETADPLFYCFKGGTDRMTFYALTDTKLVAIYDSKDFSRATWD